MPNPHVRPFFHADTCTWSYVVHDPHSPAAAIIDPVLDYDAASARIGSEHLLQMLDHIRQNRLGVQWLLETHAHADHLSAAHWLKTLHFPQAPIAIGQGIVQVQQRFRALFNLNDDGFCADGSQFDCLLLDGGELAIGSLRLQVIAVPGHTGDSNAFLIGDALFTGDSLFMPDGGTARCDFPGGDAATLYRSIQRLYALPDATRVFVCHDYAPGDRDAACETTIAAQKRHNTPVRPDVPETDFARLRQARDATLAVPRLLQPAIQVNIRAGQLPPAEANGIAYLKIPLDRF